MPPARSNRRTWPTAPVPCPKPAARKAAARRVAAVALLASLGALGAFRPATIQAQATPPPGPALRENATPPFTTNPPIILTVEGTNVTVLRRGQAAWIPAVPRQILAERDRGRTGLRSRTSVRLSDLTILRVGELSEFEIQPLPSSEPAEAEFNLFRGLLYLLNRDRPGKHRFVTPTATAATRGTEFALEVDPASGRTTLTVFEGEAELFNSAGSIRLGPGEQGVATLGQRPTRTAVVELTAAIQWCLYYPAVLDPDEIPWANGAPAPLATSLDAYARGDLLEAVATYPAGRTPGSDAERLYAAALLLAVGQPAAARDLLAPISPSHAAPRPRQLANALRTIIDLTREPATAISMANPAAKTEPEPGAEADSHPDRDSTRSATATLVASYRAQAGLDLDRALALARRATGLSPRFGFAWARVAELEFSLGRADRATAALETALQLTPRNAQAVTLQGFLRAARHDLPGAEAAFNQAIALDGSLGNAWLGRGLCRLRQGQAAAGREDLQVAAATEPRRSLLRSYLGKAFHAAGDVRHASKELRVARELDPADPTPWLYSALLLQQQSRLNEGILDLQRSVALNDNRQVYRSRLLLDQDRALRGAGLANLYRDAGLTDVGNREAGRAVSADYANAAAHRFLADSYDALRDPRLVNLRYETAWFTEFLLANLLAPPGAGPLSPTLSQQEYGRFFDQPRLGIVSATEFFGHGEWRQSTVQHGASDRTAYAAGFGYHHDDGWRPNHDTEAWSAEVTLRHQLTGRDGIFFRVNTTDRISGDPNQYYDPAEASRTLRLREQNEPALLAGYHHEWQPGRHTLLLAGYVANEYSVRNPEHATLFLNRFAGNPISAVAPMAYEQDYDSRFEMFTVEPQQIWQHRRHTLVLGGRYQGGHFATRDRESDGELYTGAPVAFTPSAAMRHDDFSRLSGYAYDHWQLWPTLLLAGGIAYDRVEVPLNHRYGPITEGTITRDQLSPKAGLVFTPWTNTTARAAWFRGLGGASLDQSYRLEPSQVAGFNQAFRSVIPESVAGANAAPTFDGWGLSFEQRLRERTFLAIEGEGLSSQIHRRIGVVDFQIPTGPGSPPPFSVRQLRESLDYRERTLRLSARHLLNDEWSLGISYRLSKAELESSYPEIPPTAGLAGGFESSQDVEAILHQVQLNALFQHPSGLFAGGSALWTQQSNQGYSIDRPGDDFWQFNLEAGWRLLGRRIELRTGILNVTGQDYRLNPLNLTTELPRDREFFASLRLNF